MERLVTWCGFVGAWLLVAGPIYQAALELQAEEVETRRIREVQREVTPPPRVSVWWWLVPPVKMALENRRSTAYRNAYMSALTRDEISAMVSFFNKATGWLYVASGALLLAFKETYSWATFEHFSRPVFWATSVFMTFFCLGNVIAKIKANRKMIEEKERSESMGSPAVG